jgi:hypothetical protein
VALHGMVTKMRTYASDTREELLDCDFAIRVHLPKITQNGGEIVRSPLPSLSSPRHFYLQTI